MTNKQLSQIIKKVREDKKIKIELLSISTKIPVKYIEAIELEEYDKIPAGPYINLYMSNILEELDIDLETYKLNNDSSITSNTTIKEEIIKKEFIKPKNSTSKSSISKVERLKENDRDEGSKSPFIISIVFILIGVIISIFLYQNEQKIRVAELKEQKADSLKLVEDREAYRSDSILRMEKIKDSLKLVEDEQKEFKLKNKSDLKQEKIYGWVDPLYKEAKEDFIRKIYSNNKNPFLKIKATKGYVKIGFYSKKDKWWKKIDYKDSLVLNLPMAASIKFYNANNCEVIYKNIKVNFKNYKYVKYIFKYSSLFKLQKIYSKEK